MVVSAIDKRRTCYTFTQLTFTVNIMMTNNTERRCTGINRMWISGSEFKRFTDICNTVRWTNNRVFNFSNSINITTTRTDRVTTYRTITDVSTVTHSNRRGRRRTSIRWTRCYTNRKDLRDKQGDLVSDLKISSDWRGNIYALEVHTNTVFSNSGGLTVLENDTALLFRSLGFTGMQTDINWWEDSFDGSGGKPSVL